MKLKLQPPYQCTPNKKTYNSVTYAHTQKTSDNLWQQSDQTMNMFSPLNCNRGESHNWNKKCILKHMKSFTRYISLAALTLTMFVTPTVFAETNGIRKAVAKDLREAIQDPPTERLEDGTRIPFGLKEALAEKIGVESEALVLGEAVEAIRLSSTFVRRKKVEVYQVIYNATWVDEKDIEQNQWIEVEAIRKELFDDTRQVDFKLDSIVLVEAVH